MLTSSKKSETAVHCCNPALSVLVMLVSRNVFHVVSALLFTVFAHIIWLIRSLVDPTLDRSYVCGPLQFVAHLTNIACIAGVNGEGVGIVWEETRGRRVTAPYSDKEARFQSAAQFNFFRTRKIATHAQVRRCGPIFLCMLSIRWAGGNDRLLVNHVTLFP